MCLSIKPANGILCFAQEYRKSGFTLKKTLASIEKEYQLRMNAGRWGIPGKLGNVMNPVLVAGLIKAASNFKNICKPGKMLSFVKGYKRTE